MTTALQMSLKLKCLFPALQWTASTRMASSSRQSTILSDSFCNLGMMAALRSPKHQARLQWNEGGLGEETLDCKLIMIGSSTCRKEAGCTPAKLYQPS